LGTPATLLRNRYRVISRLGAGAGGSVFAVEDSAAASGSGSRLALKALFIADGVDDTLLSLLKHEFRVLAGLRHPRLARVYDFGRLPKLNPLGPQGGYFFTRDLIDGKDLASYCSGRSVREVCSLMQRVANALHILHRAGMLHGDFKPQNAIVDDLGQPHLIDFGLVRGEGSAAISGTGAYLSPELLRGEHADRRADLYAVGVALFELLVGRTPLPGASLSELFDWHLNGVPLTVTPHRKVPKALDDIVARLTERIPERRFPSAEELSLALGSVVESLQSDSSRSDSDGVWSGGDDAITPPAAEATRREFVPPRSKNGGQPEALAQLERAVAARLLGIGAPPATAANADSRVASAVVSVLGDSGGGKSSLLETLTWHCQLRNLEVFRVAFEEVDSRPYGALSDLLDQVQGVCELPHPLADAALREKISSLDTLSADDDGGRYALAQKVRDYLQRVADRLPLLLLLDDVDRADAESVAILRFLAHTLDASAPVLLVLFCRADGQPKELAELGEAVTLQPFSQEIVSELFQLAAERADEPLAAQIYEHTGGNPRFVQQVLEQLWHADFPAHPDLEGIVPTQLEARYRQRFEQLPANCRLSLAAMAVIGRAADGGLLLQVVERVTAAEPEEGPVGLPLELLEATGWITRHAEGLWAFRQAPLAGVIYSLIETQKARALHAAAAEIAQQREPKPVGAALVEITRHRLMAGHKKDVSRQLFFALAHLSRVGAYRRAISLAETAQNALSPFSDAAERSKLALRLGELYLRAGHYAQAAECLAPLLDCPDEALRNDAALALCRVWRLSGRADRALALSTELIADQPDQNRLAAAFVEQAAALEMLDKHDKVLETVSLAETHPAIASGGAAYAELLMRAAWSLGHLDRQKDAYDAFSRGIEVAKASGNKRVYAELLGRLAGIDWRRGEYAHVGERYQQALTLMAELGDVERAAAIRANLGSFELQRGALASAQTSLSAALRLFEGIGASQHAATVRCNLGQLSLEIGLLERASMLLLRARDDMKRLGRRSGEALASLLLALLAARKGDVDSARLGIAQAREIYEAVGQSRDATDAQLDLAELELSAGRPAAAKKVLESLADVDLSDLADLDVRKAILEMRLLAYQPSCDEAAARALLKDAKKRIDELDSPRESWRFCAAAMELTVAIGDNDQAAEHAHSGLEVLERMSNGLPKDAEVAFWSEARRRAVREHVRGLETLPPTLAGDDALDGLATEQTVLQRPVRQNAQQSAILSHVSFAERFYRLFEIYRHIASELDYQRLVGLVMDAAVELTGAERGFLLLGDSPAALRVEIARNIDLEAAASAYSRSIAERVFLSGQPVITISAHNDPRFADYVSVHQLQLESVLCIPVHAGGKSVGVLYMESRFQSGRFTKEDQRLVMAFGDQVAIALTNARLYAENIKKTEQLEKANREIEALAEERGRLLAERTEQLKKAQQDLAETRRFMGAQRGRFGLIGASRPMQHVFSIIERVANADVPVLVEGESGTGKEMIARAVHQQGSRSKKRLVSINCAAIPENLLESELFGHVRGAFTGADREKKGLFASADGGTLFLDEIGDMPARMQVDLLRALQEKTIRPVGGNRDIRVDVRVVAASNKPLAELVRTGVFREDLFYRLHVIRIDLPPLRERSDDVPLLVDHFLDRIASQMDGRRFKLTRAAMRCLMEYSWPGNVRQLEHALLNAAVLAEGEVLDEGDFTLQSPLEKKTAEPPPPVDQQDHEGREKRRILAALEEHNWNKSKAANALGMPRRTFYRRLRAYGIQ
jgi:serine/threonine-protein kinase PknK